MLITECRALQKLINQHTHMFSGKFRPGFPERPGACLLSFPSALCGTPLPHPPGLHLPSGQEQSSRRAGPGLWGRPDAPRESLGARWPRSPAGRGSLRLWAKVVPPFLHSSSAAHPTVPITISFVSAAIFLLP